LGNFLLCSLFVVGQFDGVNFLLLQYFPPPPQTGCWACSRTFILSPKTCPNVVVGNVANAKAIGLTSAIGATVCSGRGGLINPQTENDG
jgi:hypothetical protein